MCTLITFCLTCYLDQPAQAPPSHLSPFSADGFPPVTSFFYQFLSKCRIGKGSDSGEIYDHLELSTSTSMTTKEEDGNNDDDDDEDGGHLQVPFP